jgi:DNA-binding transcriptional LysR family regulator
MEMHQIRYFLAVAQELNFTRAAETCHVAQPSLTRAIKLLEEELGGPLFNRERSRTHLTELGRMVQPYLTEALERTRAVKEQAINFVRLKQVALKLGIMCTIGPPQLVELLGGLHSQHDGIELEMLDGRAKILEEKLLNGDIEAAIYCLPEHEPDERLHYMPLFREQFMVVIGPGHPLARNNAVRVKDLHQQKYLLRTNCEYNEVGPIFSSRGSKCQIVYRSERDDWVQAMAAAGLGFAFIPRYSVTHEGVVSRPLIDPEFWREVNLVTVRGRPHSPAVGALVREAMRANWLGEKAISRQRAEAQADA